MSEPVIRKAGGIVVRYDADRPRVLIVTARDRRKRWVLPKGRVKDGELPAAAALREVEEEGGVTGTVVSPAGVAEYRTNDERVRVDYFLIEHTGPHQRKPEEREARWYAVEDAIAMLSFASARRVLLEAHPQIAERAARHAGGRRRAPRRAGRRQTEAR